MKASLLGNKMDCTPDFSKNELIPAVIQDSVTRVILMVGYMNKEAFETTNSTGFVHFFSRSRQKLWKKGETSGNVLKLVSIKSDCDSDCILVSAEPAGPICHTGAPTCFKEENESPKINFLSDLEALIKDRENSSPRDSYTASLFAKGPDRIAQKVGEEAVEVIIAAIKGEKLSIIEESADLLFHFLILLRVHELSINDVIAVLRSRNKEKK